MNIQGTEQLKAFKKNNKYKLKDILNEHGELIAALSSGLLMLIGWLISYENTAASVILFVIAFVIGGYAKAKEGIEETLKEKSLNVELLMFLAAIGSALIGYWWEGGVLIFIFSLSGALETYTTNKSSKEISALLDVQPETATLLINGSEHLVRVDTLDIGDIIIVKPGERIPADGVIAKGETTIDESTITGESMPVRRGIEHEVFAGTMNINGAITIEVTKKGSDTLFQKIIHLVQTAQSEKSPSQLFIEKFEDKYVKIVLFAVLVMMVLPHYTIGWSWNETLYRAMVLLVVASPCALVASIMPATLSAISNSARKGILFKGGIHIERLGHIKAIAFDKTGTLTKGKPAVTDIVPTRGMEKNELLKVAASIENHTNHPLGLSITSAFKKNGEGFMEMERLEEVPGLGMKAMINGSEWRVGQADFMTGLTTANEKLAAAMNKDGKTVVYVGNGDGVQGLIALKDTIREDTVKTVKLLKKLGIHTVMLTGDNDTTAQAIAAEAGVDDYVAKCLPEEKLQHIKNLKKKYGAIAMVGDGINDAPALATADVGIAMGGGTDVALETADVVLMKNHLEKISHAIGLSKKMNRIVKQNMIFAVAVILMLITSNFFEAINLPFGVVGHEGSTILVILNGLRLLRGNM